MAAKALTSGMATTFFPALCAMKAVAGGEFEAHANRQRFSGARQLLENVRQLEPERFCQRPNK